jgi:hypothetical protein
VRLATDHLQIAAALGAQVEAGARPPSALAPAVPAPEATPPPAPDLLDRLTGELEFEFLRRYGRSGGGR